MSDTDLRNLAAWLFDLSRYGNSHSLADISLAIRLGFVATTLANLKELLP